MKPVNRKLLLIVAALGVHPRGDMAQAPSPIEPEGNVRGVDVHSNPMPGVNFSLDYMAQHDSSTGWANILTPTLYYRFNRRFTLTASMPFYVSVHAFDQEVAADNDEEELLAGKNLLGDATIAGHFEASRYNLNYHLTVAGGLKTGNYRYGLGTEHTTYNVTHQFEYGLGRLDPYVQLGIGDSSNLVDLNVRRTYSAFGPLANFQVGTAIDLPLSVSLELGAYEELPIGKQTVFGTITRRTKIHTHVTDETLEGAGSAEDNGLFAGFNVPLGHNLHLFGSYERSLIQALDTASVGVLWTLRLPGTARGN